MPAEREERLVGGDIFDAENLLPDISEASFHLVGRGGSACICDASGFGSRQGCVVCLAVAGQGNLL